MTDSAQSRTKLPFSYWWPLGIGAVVGLGLRLIFSNPAGEAFSAMSGTFIYLVPFVVGAVTVYLAERRKRRTWMYYVSAGAVANVMFVLGSLIILIEGFICAIIIVPLFMLIGAIGGLFMGLVCRMTKRSGPTLYSIALAPFVLGGIEGDMSPPDRVDTVMRTVRVDAPASAVWESILVAPEIEPDEVPGAWLYRIGVPLPVSGYTMDTPDGPMRRVVMGKNIYFDEVISHFDPYIYLKWTYQFYEDSFPPNALDEHVVVGGHYFDVLDTSYSLAPDESGTSVTVEIRYRVSTSFNWYARPIARFLIGNLAESNLDYYRRQNEKSQ